MARKNQKKTAKPEQWFAQGVQFHGQGCLDDAALLYQQVVQHRPDHAQALNNWGLVCHDQERLDQAAALFKQALTVKPDFPEAMNNLASLRQQQGHLDEARTLFLQAIQIKPSYMEAHFNVGTLYQALGQWDFAQDSFSQALKLQPNNPQILFHLGFVLQHQGQFQKAGQTYQQVLKFQPHHLQALNNLGIVWDTLGDTHQAVDCFKMALHYQPNFPEALNNCGNVLLKQGTPLLALAYYEQALSLNPEYVEALCNLGGGLHQVGRLEAALDMLQKAQFLCPDFPSAHYNESLIRLLLGDYPLGFKKFEWRWLSKDIKPHGHEQPLWNGQPLPEATILVHCEQGFGDSIHFIRYVQQVKSLVGQVVVLCSAPLQRLLQTVPGIDRLVCQPDPIPHCDYQVPLLSLPYSLGTTLETIPNAVPYLKPDPNIMARFASRLERIKTVKIGIAWRGNPQQKNDGNRSMDPKNLVRLLDVPGCTFINLQKGGTDSDRNIFVEHPHWIDWTAELSDFADTAALIAQLDLVISVDTSVIHLTGALGQPGWAMLAAVPDWRWLLDRTDCPWYPTLHLFRQSQSYDWEKVVDRVIAQLQTFLVERLSPMEPLGQNV